MDNIRENLTRILTSDPDLLKNLNTSVINLVRLVRKMIDNGVTVQEWIPVTERLPEEDTRVLVWLAPQHYEYTNVDTDRFYRGRWVRWNGRVTHWMPLPIAPKGE